MNQPIPSFNNNHTFIVSFEEAEDVAEKVTEFLEGAKIPLGIGLVGLMMVIAQQATDQPTIGKVSKMVQDMSEYVGAYWGEGD